jgi:hypothetical protein
MLSGMRPDQLWERLESASDLEERLEAVEELEMWVQPEPAQVRRLERCRVAAPPALSKALDHLMLRMRRDQSQKQLLTATSSSSLDEHRSEKLREEARKALKDPDPQVRLDYLERAVREEHFGAAPALATAALMERDEAVKAGLAKAVGKLAADGAVRLLEKVARAKTRPIQLAGVQGLAFQVGRPRDSFLIRLAGATDAEVRRAAREVLASTSVTALEQAAASAGAEASSYRKVLVRVLSDRLSSSRVRELLGAWSSGGDPDLENAARVALG